MVLPETEVLKLALQSRGRVLAGDLVSTKYFVQQLRLCFSSCLRHLLLASKETTLLVVLLQLF